MNKTEIAIVCHEANRAYCETLGDTSQLKWIYAPQWQQESAIKGVEFCQENPKAPASANHESWMQQKLDDGWVYGEIKDPVAKTHPCIVAFDQLPIAQQRKDILFKSIVAALTD